MYRGEFTNNVEKTQDNETFVKGFKDKNKRTENKRFRMQKPFSTSDFAVRWFFILNSLLLRNIQNQQLNACLIKRPLF